MRTNKKKYEEEADHPLWEDQETLSLCTARIEPEIET